jgi:L-amino acid N-acyltransferase YncA
MHVRNATMGDLESIVAIYNSTIASRQVTADLEPVTIESRLGWFDAHDAARYPLWVAEAESGMLGWVSFSAFYGRPAYRRTAEISIYLAPSARGQGLGGKLLESVLKRAPEFGFSTLVGFIFGHNLPSLALFEKFGFSRFGMLPGVAEFEGTKRDLVIVGLALPQT